MDNVTLNSALQIVYNALDMANQKGMYTLSDSVAISNSYSIISSFVHDKLKVNEQSEIPGT